MRLPLDAIGTIANVGQLADLVQRLTGAADTPKADTALDTVILHGNCQMDLMRSLLAPVVAPKGLSVAHVSSFVHPLLQTSPAPELVARCGVFIEQVSPWESALPASYASDLPADCRRLRVPALMMKSLWPLHQQDPRNQFTAEHPFGRHPYGDAQVLKLLRQTQDPDEVFRLYMDVDLKALMSLDRLHEMTLAQAAEADRMADLPLTPTIEANFTRLRLFDTVNHPSPSLQLLLRDVLAEFILEGADGLPAWRPPPSLQVPIHPQVVEHFKLEWTDANAVYFYGGRYLTFEEYLRAYIAFA